MAKGFARADGPGQDQILWGRHPLAAGQGVDLRRVESFDRREVKRVERFDLGETCLAQPLADHRLVPRGQLRTERLVQVVLVRPVRVTGLARERFKDARDAGQFQRAGVRDDQVADDDRRRHAGTPVSQRS
jgi:hypothetical protein